jgi:peptidyl-prolyl cis-trans isomerase C
MRSPHLSARSAAHAAIPRLATPRSVVPRFRAAGLTALLLCLPLTGFAQSAPSRMAPSPMAPSRPAPSATTAAPAPQAAPAGNSAAAPAQGSADPVVGSVEGHLIYLSDLAQASQTLPPNLRDMPFDTLYPVLLDRMIDHEALVLMARRNGLEETKVVQQQIQEATEKILEGAYLGSVANPQVTEQTVQALYNRQFANRPATEEVHARHILVTSEAEALKVLNDLKNGADFTTIARVVSKDPDAAKGGDLGFFRREQVWPGFADIAFSLQPGQVAPKPIHNEFGWHVIKVEERRLVAPPSYSEVHDQLRQQLLANVVQKAIDQAKDSLVIHRFNLDGSELDTGPHLHMDPGPSAQLQR